MAKHVNVTRGLLILPSGEEVRPGGEFDMTADLAKNAGVASWLADGFIAPASSPEAKVAAKAADRPEGEPATT